MHSFVGAVIDRPLDRKCFDRVEMRSIYDLNI